MSLLQPANGGNPSDSLSCPRCHTQLPPQAVFCSSCGERVKKIGDGQTGTEDGEENAQEQNVDTVRVASLSQTQWKRWQASRSPQSSKGSEPSHLNSSLFQDAEAPKSSLLETELPRTEPVDGQAPRQTPMPIELSEPLPTTPVPSI